MKKNLDTIYTSSKIRISKRNDKPMSYKISNEQLDKLATKASFKVADEHREDFASSLTKIIDLFHAMSQVKVCEYKQYGQHTLRYDELRQDDPTTGPNTKDVVSSCAHFNAETHYFETPKVIEESN